MKPAETPAVPGLVVKAASLRPQDPNIISTLGIAQYRAGQFEAAIETLRRSAALYAKQGSGSMPADLAFTAMAYAKLGEMQKARGAVEELRKLIDAEPAKADSDARAFLSEAETLIEGSGGK